MTIGELWDKLGKPQHFTALYQGYRVWCFKIEDYAEFRVEVDHLTTAIVKAMHPGFELPTSERPGNRRRASGKDRRQSPRPPDPSPGAELDIFAKTRRDIEGL